MLSDLDEMALRCVDKGASIHIREAIQSYNHGGFRAAIVASYIAVNLDLISKLKGLAADGDQEAIQQVANLTLLQEQQNNNSQSAISGLLSFERGIFQLFRDKFEFFGVNEYQDMERLQADRNRCAHPTFQHSSEPYQPSAELARLHLRNSLSHVLTQEAKQGKAALFELQNAVLSSYFPQDEKNAIEFLKSSVLSKARSSLIRLFIDECMFGIRTSTSPYFKKVSAVYAVHAAASLHRDEVVARATLNANKLLKVDDENLWLTVATVLRMTDVAEEIDARGRIVIKKWLAGPLPVAGANVFVRALRINWLAPRATALLKEMSVPDLRNLTVTPPEVMIDHALKKFSTSPTWNASNELADKTMLPIVKYLSKDQIDRVLKAAAAGDADLIGSTGFRKFLDSVASDSPIGVEGRDALLTAHEIAIPGARNFISD